MSDADLLVRPTAPVAAVAPARPRVVVVGWGNTARGDDAIGPLLAERIAALELPGVTAIEDHQLQIEHALDLDGADLALFVDADSGGGRGAGADAPFVFRETTARAGPAQFSHAITPEDVLDVRVRVLRRPAPPAFVLGVRGDRFGLGTDLGAAAARRLEAAFAFVVPLLVTPDAAAWRRAAAAGRHAGNPSD